MFALSLNAKQIYLTRKLLGAIIPGQSGQRNDDNERVLHIPQSSSITGASPLDFFKVLTRIFVLSLCRKSVAVFGITFGEPYVIHFRSSHSQIHGHKVMID